MRLLNPSEEVCKDEDDKSLSKVCSEQLQGRYYPTLILFHTFI